MGNFELKMFFLFVSTNPVVPVRAAASFVTWLMCRWLRWQMSLFVDVMLCQSTVSTLPTLMPTLMLTLVCSSISTGRDAGAGSVVVIKHSNQWTRGWGMECPLS